MLDSFSQYGDRNFRLRPGGLDCNAFGVTLGDAPLLTRSAGSNGRGVWKLGPERELEAELSALFGAPISLAGKRLGLDLIARSLTRGDLALAQIAALHLQFPEPPPLGKSASAPSLSLLTELAMSGLLALKWEEDEHPRTGTPPNPGWFAPKDEDGEGDTQTAENDKEPRPTRTDAEPSGPKPTASALRQARRIKRALRLFISEIAGKVKATDDFLAWTAAAIGERFGQSIAALELLAEAAQLPINALDREKVLRALAEARAAARGPKTLEELQRQPTEDFEGYDEHHIVQQTDENILKSPAKTPVKKFGRDKIESPANLVWIPRLRHQMVTGYYNSIVTVNQRKMPYRDVIGALDFDSQYQDGLATLRMFGILK